MITALVPLEQSLAPSMDIMISSNFERSAV